MPAKALEAMRTIADSVPADTTYDDLSFTTRELQDRIRQQYQQNLEKRAEQASLRHLAAAAETTKTGAAAISARSDRESLRILEAATRAKKSTHPRHRSSRKRHKIAHVEAAGDGIPTEGRPATGSPRSTSHSPRALASDLSQISQQVASSTRAAGRATTQRMQAHSTLVSSAETLVHVESSPSTPSSSLLRLPVRPTVGRALETDSGPSGAPVRPWIPQRMLTAFPEIGRLVGAVAPQPIARTFARVDSGAYSSDHPPSSGRPLRPIGESRSPSWSSEEEVGGASTADFNPAEEVTERYNKIPSKVSRRSLRQSRISSWMSEEEALATTRRFAQGQEKNERKASCSSGAEVSGSAEKSAKDFFKHARASAETPSTGSKHRSGRQMQSPSWSSMEEALGDAKDARVDITRDGDGHSETPSKTSMRSTQQARSPPPLAKDDAARSGQEDLISFEEEDETGSLHASVGRAGFVEDDFDLIQDDASAPSKDTRQNSLTPQYRGELSAILPAAKTQQWLEDQLADAMGSPPPATASKIQNEYADILSPTHSEQLGSDVGSLKDKSACLGEDGEVEEFEDWEDLGNKR